jgi:hypothetical protein
MDKIWILTVTRENDADGLVVNTYPYVDLDIAQRDMKLLSNKLINDSGFNIVDRENFLLEVEKNDYEDYYLIKLEYKTVHDRPIGLEMVKEEFSEKKFIDWYNEIDFRKELCSFIESDDILWEKVKVRVSIDSECHGYEEIDYRVNDLILKGIIEETRDMCGDIYTIKIDFVFDDDAFEYEKYPSYIEGYVYEGLFNSGKTVMRPFS